VEVLEETEPSPITLKNLGVLVVESPMEMLRVMTLAMNHQLHHLKEILVVRDTIVVTLV
jgi:hypothetical protein